MHKRKYRIKMMLQILLTFKSCFSALSWTRSVSILLCLLPRQSLAICMGSSVDWRAFSKRRISVISRLISSEMNMLKHLIQSDIHTEYNRPPTNILNTHSMLLSVFPCIFANWFHANNWIKIKKKSALKSGLEIGHFWKNSMSRKLKTQGKNSNSSKKT